MKRGFSLCLALGWAMLAACTSEDTPSSPSVTLTAPTIRSPEPGSSVDSSQPTLVVGNATGSAAPTYRFEVAKDSAFGSMAAQADGIPQGSDGTTSWQVSTPLEPDERYFWRARASAAGVNGPYSSAADFRVEAGYFRREPVNNLLVFDPLTNGGSVGEVRGGTFNDQGWMCTAASNYIRYDVPTIRSGFVEFQVTNLREPNPRSDKRMLMIMWDPTAGEYTQNAFRMHLQKMDNKTVTFNHVRLRFITQAEEHNDGWSFVNWDRSQVYTWRFEWGDFEGEIRQARVLLDGVQRLQVRYEKAYKPKTHWIELGAAPRTESLEEAIFSNVRIGIR